ncbi:MULTISPECIES: AcvB/VirJ family lysyl-phosphatidylglycerol hydrolase [unclassified Sphingomonas]|uniref:AcvB/VirJ family lysyl-phosphatidylglycerol hydrolase n=1 Tax=unclassified Sphingomonas TaxID=196159 RepID=UPI0006F93BDC|nr:MULTISPECIES: AcvB/VirJ family lysyl-phosphatidylglycerol hydrolase [unclassified Sphingomonas]KQX19508.1 type IV secretion system protein VirJ [Sphingomonas sp. Root1294]KQY65709.1 type IV secretion system protein VirJ [Sphingomonas sp. Root50]KRB94987.1 type IV secretion system protein VirJ [Sphingomonas sp. Root720]
MRRILTGVVLALVLVGAGLTAWWGWLGYFGGDVYVPVKARRAPSPAHAGLAAVILSGDMGFKIGMARQVADRLAADGIPVLGVNSLVYFRERRSPAEVRALIGDAVRRGLAFGHARRLLLIGQSYGADMVHVGLVGLPPDLRARLAMVALVVPTDTVMYQASPAEMLDLVPADAAAIDTGRRLDWVPLLCVQGRDETDSLCPMLDQSNMRRIAMPGGHPLRRDADGLYRHLLGSIDALPAR